MRGEDRLTRQRGAATTIDRHGATSALGVRLDAGSGLPTAMLRAGEPAGALPVAIALTVVTGGVERLGPIGGLQYTDTTRTPLAVELTGMTSDRGGDRHIVEGRSGDWDVELEYRFAERSPRIAFGFTLGRSPSAPPELLRDVELTFTFALDDPSDWLLNAPGNHFRADLPVDRLAASLPILSPGDQIGSPGLIALSRRIAHETVVLWPLCETETGEIDLDRDGRCVRVTITTGLAGLVAAGAPGPSWRSAHLEWLPRAWPGVRAALGVGIVHSTSRPRPTPRAGCAARTSTRPMPASRSSPTATVTSAIRRSPSSGPTCLASRRWGSTSSSSCRATRIPATTCTTTRTSPPPMARRPTCVRWWPSATAAGCGCCWT